jgi:hypothetical protein
MSRRVFTPAVLMVISEMANQGKSASEIAVAIGSTPASVRVRCCQLKIPLARRGRPPLVPGFPRHSSMHKLVVSMPPAALLALQQKASQMRKSPIELAARLLQEVVGANIFKAVLDN